MPIGPNGRMDVRRALSLLVYLTPDDWNAATDGGCLRVFAPQPRSAASQQAAAPGTSVDVQPTAGSLVIFDSSSVPQCARYEHLASALRSLTTHSARISQQRNAYAKSEVLTTQRERLLIAGWLHESV